MDRVDAYLNNSNLSFVEGVLQSLVFNTRTLFLFFYFSTKYIDFALYVKAWMIGYKVDHKFDSVSYFIMRSCFYRDDISESNSTETNFAYMSAYHTQSVVKALRVLKSTLKT